MHESQHVTWLIARWYFFHIVNNHTCVPLWTMINCERQTSLGSYWTFRNSEKHVNDDDAVTVTLEQSHFNTYLRWNSYNRTMTMEQRQWNSDNGTVTPQYLFALEQWQWHSDNGTVTQGWEKWCAITCLCIFHAFGNPSRPSVRPSVPPSVRRSVGPP